MADDNPAQFFDIRSVSADWHLSCPTHGDVNMVIMFNGDVQEHAYCQQCFEDNLHTLASKITFRQNGGPPVPPDVT